MSKTTSLEIYHLIHSLSGSEQRYFKLYVSKQIGKQNEQSLKLFNLIVNSKKLSVAEVEKRITFTKYASSLKNYTYALILRSLEAFYYQHSLKRKILNTVIQVQILLGKTLYKESITLIKKGLVIANKTGNQSLKIELYNLYLEAFSGVTMPNRSKASKKIVAQRHEAITKLQTETELSILRDALYDILSKIGEDKDVFIKTEVNKLMQHKLLSNKKDLSSSTSMYFYHYILAFSFRYLKEYTAADAHFQEILVLYKSNPHGLDQHTYIKVLNAFIENRVMMRSYVSVAENLEEMEAIKPHSQRNGLRIFECLSVTKTEFLVRIGKFKEALNYAETVIEKYEQYKSIVHPMYREIAYTFICYTLFVLEQRKEALKYNNFIINNKLKIYRKDVYRNALIMQLLIQVENKDKGSVKYLLISYQSFLKTRKKVYAYEKWFVSFFKFLIKDKNQGSVAYYQQEELVLLHIFKNAIERDYLEHFNMLLWLRIKAGELSFSEAAEEFSSKSYEEYAAARKLFLATKLTA